MKKYVCVVLAVLLAMTVCACAAGSATSGYALRSQTASNLDAAATQAIIQNAAYQARVAMINDMLAAGVITGQQQQQMMQRIAAPAPIESGL